MPRADLRQRIGYKGLVLLWLGWVFFFIGLVLIPAQPPAQDNLFHTQLDLPWRVVLWSGPGVVGIVTGLITHLPIRVMAFVLLTIAPALRMVSYGSAFILDSLDRIAAHPNAGVLVWLQGDVAWPRLAQALVYTSITIGVLLFASWPEPPRPSGVTPEYVESLRTQ